MIKRFVIAVVLLALVCGGIVGFNIFRERAIEQFFANMPVPSVTVSTLKVEPVTWTPGIGAIGTVSAARGVDLTVETAGIVKETLFSANEQVDAGKVLVQLDDAMQQADLAAAKAQASLDKLSLDRALELQKRGVGSEVTVEAARASATTSASQVVKLQAVVDQKQLKAPFSGTMGIPRIENGQYIAPGNVVATLQDLETMRTDFTVPEQQLGQIRIGQPVIFGLTGADMRYHGSITGIDPKVDPASRLVSVRAEMFNPDRELSPGQFIQVRVVLPKEDGVIAIPQTALTSSLYGDFVFIVGAAKEPDAPAPGDTPDDAQAAGQPGGASAKPTAPSLVASQVFVKTGRRSEGRVEIIQGVAAGDEIVTAGQNRLSNGAPVSIDNSVAPAIPAEMQSATQ